MLLPSRRQRTSLLVLSTRSWWDTAVWLKPSSCAHIPDAQLGLEQRVQDADAGGISEHLEQLRQIVQHFVRRHVLGHLPDHLGVDAGIQFRKRPSGFAHMDLIFFHMNICSYDILFISKCQAVL